MWIKFWLRKEIISSFNTTVTVWTIWIERNNYTFNGTYSGNLTLWETICPRLVIGPINPSCLKFTALHQILSTWLLLCNLLFLPAFELPSSPDACFVPLLLLINEMSSGVWQGCIMNVCQPSGDILVYLPIHIVSLSKKT